MSGLEVNNSIDVSTNHGECKIQLCLGSVTKVQDKMDVLVISAYPGDYSATPTSVIGALRRDLQINVRELARNKEEDLRKLFSCWWSKPLPDELPYKRILCFEGGFKKDVRPPSTVSEVFRSLVTLFGNEDINVMMPLLAAGDQGYSKSLMLRLIVEAAIHWMQIGLPLKLLNIVVFTRKPQSPDSSVLQLTNYFKQLKKKWQNSTDPIQVDTSFKYDIYLSSSTCDRNIANMVLESLKKQNKQVRIYHERQEINEEESWQDEIYKVIVTCAKVIAILSPKYLEDSSCIEQYNIALCCSRHMNREYLAPLYVEEIIGMPTYMGLIQYVDCRPITDKKISLACQLVSSSIRTETADKFNEKLKDKNRREPSLDDRYDVFLSYSHKDTPVANVILSRIKVLRPDWNVFIDQSGLKTGSAWQSKLYESIENSRTVLALLSYNYIDSKVCQEEYNLARALHEDPNYGMHLIELKIQEIDIWPVWCTPNFIIDVTDEHISQRKIQQVVSMIDIESRTESSMQMPNAVIPIKHVTSIWRQEFAKQNFPIVQKVNFVDKTQLEEDRNVTDATKYDIVLSYHENDTFKAGLLINKLHEFLPELQISTPKNNKSLRLNVIDEGRIIVPLLSESYVNDSELMEEFNTALCKHRFAEHLFLFSIIVGELPLKPVYPQISFCLFSIFDNYWLTIDDGDPMLSCMEYAAVVLSNILIRKPQVTTSFKTLVSMRELEEWSYFRARHGEDAVSDLLPLHFISNSLNYTVFCKTSSNGVVSPKENLMLEELSSENKNLDVAQTKKDPDDKNATPSKCMISHCSMRSNSGDEREPINNNSTQKPKVDKLPSENDEIEPTQPLSSNYELQVVQSSASSNEQLLPEVQEPSSTNHELPVVLELASSNEQLLPVVEECRSLNGNEWTNINVSEPTSLCEQLPPTVNPTSSNRNESNNSNTSNVIASQFRRENTKKSRTCRVS